MAHPHPVQRGQGCVQYQRTDAAAPLFCVQAWQPGCYPVACCQPPVPPPPPDGQLARSPDLSSPWFPTTSTTPPPQLYSADQRGPGFLHPASVPRTAAPPRYVTRISSYSGYARQTRQTRTAARHRQAGLFLCSLVAPRWPSSNTVIRRRRRRLAAPISHTLLLTAFRLGRLSFDSPLALCESGRDCTKPRSEHLFRAAATSAHHNLQSKSPAFGLGTLALSPFPVASCASIITRRRTVSDKH
ncbi:hypothetical protein J1614_008910 [Plenodomus biglobosus]|nr:hypothetical protein J1614_008910 [Plenodomus biglobosus]